LKNSGVFLLLIETGLMFWEAMWRMLKMKKLAESTTTSIPTYSSIINNIIFFPTHLSQPASQPSAISKRTP